MLASWLKGHATVGRAGHRCSSALKARRKCIQMQRCERLYPRSPRRFPAAVYENIQCDWLCSACDSGSSVSLSGTALARALVGNHGSAPYPRIISRRMRRTCPLSPAGGRDLVHRISRRSTLSRSGQIQSANIIVWDNSPAPHAPQQEFHQRGPELRALLALIFSLYMIAETECHVLHDISTIRYCL
jgi:hypothetical protein